MHSVGVSECSRYELYHGQFLWWNWMIAAIWWIFYYFYKKEPVSCWRRKCLIKLNLQYLRRSPGPETSSGSGTEDWGWADAGLGEAESPIFVGLALGQIPDKPLKLSDLNILNVMMFSFFLYCENLYRMKKHSFIACYHHEPARTATAKMSHCPIYNHRILYICTMSFAM